LGDDWCFEGPEREELALVGLNREHAALAAPDAIRLGMKAVVDVRVREYGDAFSIRFVHRVEDAERQG